MIKVMTDELFFASEDEALQRLADLTGHRIVVSADEDEKVEKTETKGTEEVVDKIPSGALQNEKKNVILFNADATAQLVKKAMSKVKITDGRVHSVKVKDKNGKVTKKFIITSRSSNTPFKHGMAVGAAIATEMIRHDEIEL